MTRKEFVQTVRLAVEALPETAKQTLENVAFMAEEAPRQRKTREIGIRRNEILLGLYEGVPKIRRGDGYFGVLPDRITLFREPLEQASGGDPDKLRRMIQEVVWHEIGHHLGFDEPALRALEKRRARRYDT